jgi:hypothetical protein
VKELNEIGSKFVDVTVPEERQKMLETYQEITTSLVGIETARLTLCQEIGESVEVS